MRELYLATFGPPTTTSVGSLTLLLSACPFSILKVGLAATSVWPLALQVICDGLFRPSAFSVLPSVPSVRFLCFLSALYFPLWFVCGPM